MKKVLLAVVGEKVFGACNRKEIYRADSEV